MGEDAEVAEQAACGARVIDASDGLVLPAFQDAHVHPDRAGLLRMRCDLTSGSGAGAYAEAVAEYAAQHPDLGWILGGGWSLEDFPGGTPHRSLLDAVVPDRPVYLPNRDLHGAWVNSRALELAGVGAGTPDPLDGRIERDPDGTPSGVLHEGAMALVASLVPSPTAAELRAALLDAQGHLHRLGVSGWQDAWTTDDTLAAYGALRGSGELTARVTAAMWWDRHRGLEQVGEMRERRETWTGGRLHATAVKVMQDGIPENRTAAMIDPYVGDGGTGMSFVDPGRLVDAVVALDRERFGVHVHAIGDRAAREALDAFAAARAANGRTDARHQIAHLQVVHPEDVPRVGALQVVANIQPFWACLDEQMRTLVLPLLGAERAGWQYPFATLAGAGATLAVGSDWPVTTPNPMEEVQVAITRVPLDDPDAPPFLPEERLGRSQALAAATMGSASANGNDGICGSLEVGKAADLVVISPDPFTVEPRRVGACRVRMTMVGGEVVWSG